MAATQTAAQPAAQPATRQPIKLADYSPPVFSVSDVALEFQLDPEQSTSAIVVPRPDCASANAIS